MAAPRSRLLLLVLLLSACGGGDGRGGTDAGTSDHNTSPFDAVVDTRTVPEDVGTSDHNTSPLDASDDESGSDTVQQTDMATPQDTTAPADMVQPQDTTPPQDTVQPEDMIQPEDIAPPEDPWPVPELSEEPPPTCQAAIDDPWYFQFLDNLCDDKVWPTDTDRDLQCPVADDSPFMTLQSGQEVEYKPSTAPVEWDTTSLDGLLPSGMRVVVILVRRVDGVPHYRYLSGGSHYFAQQPWSTTKFLAAANAAATLRIESSYDVGLTAGVGGTPLGDLVTSVHTYDNSPYTSNGLGRYFHNIGGRAKANALIHEDWLQRPASETFGGNYGDAAPNLGYTFTENNGASVTITPDSSPGPANHLSLYTLAEALKRLVLHREEPDQRLPGIQWLDLRVLLYGAEGSTKYGPWGGMTRDTAVYIQSGHDMDYIEARSYGKWRIFSKLGLGSQGQFMDVGYACWPALNPDHTPIPGKGREFLIAAHLNQGGNTWDERDRILATAYRKIILRIVDGRL